MSSNKYGYVADTGPEQSFGNNPGIFDPADINNLIADNKWTNYGQLELIETQTVSGVSAVDFTNLGDYNVHFLTINNYQPATDNTSMLIRLSDDGGSTYESSNYQWAHLQMYAPTEVYEYKSTSATSLEINRENGNATNESGNAYVYLYNLGDSTKYSFTTSQSSQATKFSGQYAMQFGSGVYKVASTIDALRLLSSSGNFDSTASLYGIKAYE